LQAVKPSDIVKRLIVSLFFIINDLFFGLIVRLKILKINEMLSDIM